MREQSLIKRTNLAGNGDSRSQQENGGQTAGAAHTVSGWTGLHALYAKELGDHLTSKRFLILLLLIGTTSLASLYGAISGLSDAISSDSNFIFLKLYTTTSNSIPSFMSFIALLGPIVGLALGFDAINSERNANTLNRLVSQPIYRDSIIIGKFLAGTTVIAAIIYAMGIALGALGVIYTGLKPDGEEVLRILVFLTFTVVYVAFWLALSIFFSVICRHASTSALASIALWIFFAIFMSLIASIVANAVYPINDQYSAMFNTLNNYNLTYTLNRLSPYYLYSEAVSTIMNPTVRSVNVVTMNQLSGAISGYLSFGQSLLLVWPHLTGLVALMLIAFGGSYIGFMRQEVRTN
jgi:ABC-2 type transport system permease protein